jgi:transketolase
MNRLGQSGPTVYGWEPQRYLDIAAALDWHAAAVDGHNIDQLAGALRIAREEKQPSIIFAQTVKGKGVSFLENVEGKHGKPVSQEELIKAKDEIEQKMQPAGEETPENWRHFSPAPLKKKVHADITTSYSIGEQTATRDAFGSALITLGKKDPDIFVLDGDVKNSTRTQGFFDAFPGRSIECFIAEQNMVSIAAGLQARGKKPFAASFAAFLSRAHDQMRMAAYSLSDIKIAGSHTGVSIGEDGPSQMGLEDIAMTRSLFGSVVLSPCDGVSAEKCTAAIAARSGMSYLRTIRGKTPVIYSDKEEFPIGGSKIVKQSENDRACVIATGICVHEALRAAKELEEEGIHIGVIDAYSLKPLDGNGLLAAAAKVPFFLTVEDHYPEGGLGEAVSAAVRGQTAVYCQAVEKLPHSGGSGELLAEQGIDASGIKERLRTILSALESE